MEKNIDKKNVLWNMIGASSNAFTSLIFAIVVTRINGLEEAGIFTYAFATACLFYVIGIYAGRAFQVTDITEKYKMKSLDKKLETNAPRDGVATNIFAAQRKAEKEEINFETTTLKL